MQSGAVAATARCPVLTGPPALDKAGSEAERPVPPPSRPIRSSCSTIPEARRAAGGAFGRSDLL